MGITTKFWIVTSVLLMAGTAFAQTEKESFTGFYRLDFATKELDDNKVINTRTYSMIVSEKEKGSMRTGSKLSIPTGRNDQFQFYDVGVNLDCSNMREMQGQLVTFIAASITVVSADPGSSSAPPPVVRTYNWSSTAIVPMRKATQIFSSDDLGSKRKLQLELTATPIK